MHVRLLLLFVYNFIIPHSKICFGELFGHNPSIMDQTSDLGNTMIYSLNLKVFLWWRTLDECYSACKESMHGKF